MFDLAQKEILDISKWKYSLQVKKYISPITFRGPYHRGPVTPSSERKVYHIQFLNNENLQLELGPLENFSPESLEEAKEQFIATLYKLKWKEGSDLNHFLGPELQKNLYPSVANALGQLWLALSTPNEKLKNHHKRVKNIQSNQLITNLDEHTNRDEHIHQVYKIKISSAKNGTSIASQVKNIHTLFKNSNVLLRLDANRALGPQELQDFWEELGKANLASKVEYFEEPLGSYSQMLELSASIPIAIDESFDIWFQNREDTFKAIVFKPTLHSGLISLNGLKSDLPIVISSSFDLNWGQFWNREIIDKLPCLDLTPSALHGLNTDQFFVSSV